MPMKISKALRTPLAVCLAAAFAAWGPAAEARVTRIIIDSTTVLANPVDANNPYQELTGRAFGELNPAHPLNGGVTDLDKAARNARGNVEYIASFRIRKPVNMANTSGLM